MDTGKKGSLPEIFRPILWSYRFENMDTEKDKHTIITQAINYGMLEHWRWIKNVYGQKEIQNVVESMPKTALRRHVRKLADLLFGLDTEHFKYASGSSHD